MKDGFFKYFESSRVRGNPDKLCKGYRTSNEGNDTLGPNDVH